MHKTKIKKGSDAMSTKRLIFFDNVQSEIEGMKEVSNNNDDGESNII